MAGYSSGFWEVIFTTVLDIPLHKLLFSMSTGKVIASGQSWDILAIFQSWGVYWVWIVLSSGIWDVALGCPERPSYRTSSWVLLTIWKGSEFFLRTGIWQFVLRQLWLRLYLRFNVLDNLHFILKPALQLIHSRRPVLLIFTSSFIFQSQNCVVVKNFSLPTGREVSLAMIYILHPICFF